MKRSIAVLLALFTLTAGAQEFPTKPVRLVVPFPPGGPLDIAGRLIGKELQERWGHPVIVENKPGSTIGPEYVVRSAPDGHVLLIISSTPLVTLPHLQKVPYDVLKDLVGVTQTTLLTYAFVVNPATGIGSIQELIERAKKAPGTLNYASAGNGSGQHLYVELLKNAADMNLTHVPYKGAAPALQAVLAGEPSMMLDVTVAVIPHVKSGKLRALMVTGGKPLDQLPGAVPFDSLFPASASRAGTAYSRPAGRPSRCATSSLPTSARCCRPRRWGTASGSSESSPPASPATPSTKSSGATSHAGAKSSSRTSCGRTSPADSGPPHPARPAPNPAAVSFHPL
jgi:tripartite-type tricarboxylate transporter receptor subunit TctC